MRASAGGAFYGWRIVSVAFLSLFVSVGFGFYSYGAFFRALAEEFGGSRLGVGVGLSLFTITNGLIAPFLGRAVDRGSMRAIMTLGACLLAAGFFVIARVESLPSFYLVLATLVALGAALLGGLTTSTLVANWFVRRRGTALGIATMGISLSGVVMAPAATALIAAVGWRRAFLTYGLLTLVIVLPAVRLFVVDRPEDMDLLPDGDTRLDATVDDSGSASGPMWHALAERSFWVIATVIALNFCANGAILTHIIPHAVDLGNSPTRAALVLSAIAAFGVLGKVIFGWIADRLEPRVALWLSSGLQAVATVGLLWAERYAALLTVAVVFGLGMGGLVPLWGALVGSVYPRRAFGRVMGLMSPVMLPLQATGVPLAGWIFDRWGSYLPAFRLFVALYLLSMLVLVLLPSQQPARR